MGRVGCLCSEFFLGGKSDKQLLLPVNDFFLQISTTGRLCDYKQTYNLI